MKLSLNFVKDYVDIDVPLKVLAEDMTKAGNEYDETEKLIPATNLVIGKVIKCEPHPDSDHMHICKVDIGTEVLDIVCGAPNVKEGIKVVVAKVGAELPGGVKIKKSIIRGQESNGMICALYEIGIEKKYLSEEDKNGIHVLESSAVVGKDPVEYMKLNDEYIDFDLTANRGDLLSIVGMAQEIAAIYDKKVKKIDVTHNETADDINKSFSLDIKTKNCSLFIARKAENVVIKESPDFIKNRLIASGIRPINNVVDISNYVMLECGQPLHFYDADKLNGKIEVRQAFKEEKLTTLDNIERTLDETDIVISDGEKGIGLAGVMGGLSTEVENYTKNIIIESAIFDSVTVRKTSKKILRSEASNRFEKGLAPEWTYIAMERACKLLEEYADATIIGGKCVYDKTEKNEKIITIKYKSVNDLLGSNISRNEILDVFTRLGFEIKYSDDEKAEIIPLSKRLDISIPEDLIEEVSRIYGVDNIKGKLPIVPMKKGSRNLCLREIRNKMVDLGLNETLTYVLINDKEVHKYTSDEFEELKLLDPMTEERNVLRYSLIPSLVKTYEYNKSHYNKDVSIFEIGRGFWKKGEEYGENQKLCALMTGEYFTGISKKQVDFYIIKGVVEEILDFLGYNERYSFVLPKKEIKEFHPGQTAEISLNGEIVGIVGRLHPEEVKEPVFVFELNLDKILVKRASKMAYKEISKYPTINKDIAIIVDNNITAKQVEDEIKKAGGKLFLKSEIFDVYTGANIGINKKSLAYSLVFGATDRTLTDEEVNEVMQKIIDRLAKTLKAELRG